MCDTKQIVTEVFFIAKITTITPGQHARLDDRMVKLPARIERHQHKTIDGIECVLAVTDQGETSNLTISDVRKFFIENMIDGK